MIHLLVQFAVLLLLAAFCGYALGRWSIRRRFHDVTEHYNRLQRMSPEKPAVDGQVMRLLHDIESSVSKGEEQGNLGERLESLEARVGKMHSQLDQRWREQEALNEKREQRERESRRKLLARLDDLASSVAEKRGSFASSRPAAPLKARLSSIESSPARGVAQASSGLSAPSGAANLLSSASYGRKDNLQAIDGVGPKLESMLNRLGVYYFWQIAQWGEEDISGVDAQLGAFRGRILRDDWVSQAKALGRGQGSAPPPPPMR